MEPAFVLSAMLYVMPSFLLLFLTFKDQLGLPGASRVVVSIILFVMVTLTASYFYITFYDSTPARAVLGLAGILSGVCIFSVCVKYSFVHNLFIISIVKSYSDSVVLAVCYIHFWIFGCFPSADSYLSAVLILVLLVLTFPLIHLFFRRLLRPALDYTQSLPTWHFLWIIPMCQTMIYTFVISPDFYREHGIYSEFFFAPPFWLLMSFATYVLLLKMIISVSETAVLQERLHLSETLVNAQLKHAEDLQAHIEETRQARHDMRHHLLALNGFVKERDWDQLEAYLRDYADLIPESTTVFCKDPALNALLCHYYENARNAWIRTRFSVTLPEKLPFPSADLCVILGNLLENALEACMRMQAPEKYIRLSLSMASSAILVLVIENSFEGDIQMSGSAFLSTKRTNRKGIGISSVTHLVEKYHGVNRFEHEDQIFKVSILLNATGGSADNEQ